MRLRRRLRLQRNDLRRDLERFGVGDRTVCKAVDRPDLAALPLAPGPDGAALRAALSALFKTRSRDEWELLLADRDCCVSGIYTPREALDNPQVKARGLIRMEDGKPLSDLPIKFSDAVGISSSCECPALGADTFDVLTELGLDEATLAALSASGAI